MTTEIDGEKQKSGKSAIRRVRNNKSLRKLVICSRKTFLIASIF